ncbi:MAG: radical SAM protein [Erysipelotrichaceae bacterium]|nr:radical SAM protein [Erysipelotrichaceae bacterium]
MIIKEKILDQIFYIDTRNSAFEVNIDFLNYAKNLSDLDLIKYNLENYNPKFLSLCINLSDGCNLKCDYCFNSSKSGKSIDLNIVEQFLNYMFEKHPNKEKYYVDLSGKGEPLLFLDKILKIKELCDNFSNKLNREVLVSFVCNGTLLSSEIANILQKRGILFGVSLDGNEYIHDLHRKTINGEKTYQKILNNVKNIEHHEYVGAATTLTKDVFSLIDSVKELGETFNTISYKPARNCESAIDVNSIDLWLEEYNKLILFLLGQSIKGDNKYIFKLLNGDDYFGKFLKRTILGQRVLIRCDGGLSRISLDNDGNLYSCPSAFTLEKFKVGRFNNLDINKQKELLDIQNDRYQCALCSFKYICGGECMIEKELSKGVNAIMCKYKKHLILLAMYFTYKLLINNKKSFDELVEFLKEVEARKKIDKNLIKFLNENPHYSFVEGKKKYDIINKKY